MSVAGVDVTTTAATTTTSTSPSIASLAEQMRVAAEHEWLYQRIQVFWAANGVTTKRSGTVLAIRWLDSAVTNATDVRQMEALAVRSLAASVRFDDDKTTVYDSELVADLSHYQEDDNDGIEEEEETQIDPFACCSICGAFFATAELWNIHSLFSSCKLAQNTLAVAADDINVTIDDNDDALFHSAAESKRASHAGSVLPSLVVELVTARDVSEAAASVDPSATRLALPDVLLDDTYAAVGGAQADTFATSFADEFQQLVALSSTLVAEAPLLREEPWTLRAFVGASAVGPASLPLVQQGLQAARIVVRVALLRDSPPLNEETFEAAIRLARAVLTNGIAPLFDSSLEVLAKQNSKLGLAAADVEPRARWSQLARAGTTLISKVLVLLAHVVTHAAELVAQRHASDVLLLALTSLAQSALLIDPSTRALPGLDLLQMAAISVLRTVFRRHPPHRSAILDDFLLSLGRQPKTTKKSARTYRVVTSSHGRARTVETIHMTSALIVQLIQSCAAVPTVKVEANAVAAEAAPPPAKKRGAPGKAAAKRAADEAAAAALAAQFETASTAVVAPDSAETPAQMARYFLATLVSRSAVPSKERDEAGYRNVFDNLLQDLLVLWPLIEWPGAETALAVLVRVLLRGLAPLDGADGDGAVSPQLRDMALSTLGAIATRAEQVHGQVGALSLGHSGLSCPCGDVSKPIVNVACVACNAVFHVACLPPDRVVGGVDAKSWRCDACLARAAVGSLLTTIAPPVAPPVVVKAKPTKAKGRGKRASAEQEEQDVIAEPPQQHEPVVVDDELVATQVTLDWLNALVTAARDSGDAIDVLLDAEKAHVSRWLARFEAIGNSNGAALMRYDYEHCLGVKPSALLLSASESQRVAALVLVHSGALLSLFPMVLRALLQLLSDKSKASRARALKALVGIVDANPRLLLEPATRRAVSDRCLDTATSVRDAALELIGKYLVLGDDELIEQFLPVTLERARDTGVSVRKRVIQILRDLCVRVPGHVRVSQICRVLVQRIGDVPSVSSAILRTFEQLWFAPLSASVGASLEQRCDQLTAVCAGAPATSDWLVDLLRRLLDAPDGAAVHELCVQLVALLAKRVIEHDEARGQAADDSADQQFVGVLATLVVFARVRQSLVMPHIVSLAHYLQVPNARIDPSDARAMATRRIDIAAALRATALFEQCAPLLGECNAELVARVEAQLSATISAQGLALVEAAVACLGKVVTHVSHNRNTMLDLLGKCTKFAEPRAVRGKLEQKDTPMLLRCLCVIGLLVQHYDFDNDAAVDFADEKAKAAAEARGDRRVADAFALLSRFVVEGVDESVRVRAVRSLCAIVARRASLMAQPVVAWLLRTEEPSHLVTAATLEGLHELLRLQQLSYATPLEPLPSVDADERGSEDDENGVARAANDDDADANNADDEKALKRSSVTFVSMHDTSDTSFVATQMQLAMPKILPHFNHANDDVRLQALKLGTMATRMGIVNPLVCVPSTLALLGDANADLAKPALALLTYLHQKHANLLHSRLVDGVRIAYQQLRARLVAARPARLTKRETTIAGAVRAINTVTYEANFGRLFELLDSNRRQREAFVVGCATQLESNSQLGRVDVPYVAFLCELLASLHYRSMHEPIEVVNVAHRAVSLHGSGVVRLCEQQLALADAATQARNVCDAAAALSLLIYLKRFLKRVWHLTIEALRDHVALSTTTQRAKTVPVRRYEGETIGAMSGFGDVILESGGDIARMKAQFETLQRLMEDELDDQFDAKGEDDQAPPPTSKQTTPNGPRKRGRPTKATAATRKKRARAIANDDDDNDDDDDQIGDEPILEDD